MSALRKEFAASLDKAIRKHGLKPASDLIFANAAECIRVSTAGADDYSAVGKSRFGGDPDLPADFFWPKHKSVEGPLKYSNFVCQIHFAELPQLSGKRRLPKSGMLYLFVSGMSGAGTPVGLDTFYYNGDVAKLKRRESPPNEKLLDEYLIDLKPNRVTFAPAFSVNAHGHELLGGIDAQCGRVPNSDETPGEQFRDLVFDLPDTGNIGGILGFANCVEKSNDLRRQIALGEMKHRKYQGCDYWPSIEKYQETLDRYKNNDDLRSMYERMKPGVEWLMANNAQLKWRTNRWQHLVCIHSNRHMDFWINDADPMYVFVKNADLEKRDFSRLAGEVTQG